MQPPVNWAEMKLPGVLNDAPFGVHLYELYPDDRLVFVGANRTANALLGVEHQQFVGKTLEEAFPALVATEIPSRYREVARTKRTWQIDQIAYDEQGIKGAYDVRAVAMGDSQVAIYFTDITKRLRTEHALLAKQAELDTYFTHALDLLCIATLDGRFKRLNPEWSRVLGYPIDELEGKRFLDYVHPDDFAATVHVLENLAGKKVVTNFVNRYRCKDGTYRNIEWRSFPSGEDIYAIAHDVTERTLAFDQLSDSEALFRSVINTMSELVSLSEIVLDESGNAIDYRTLDVNAAWETAMGRTRNESIGTTGSSVYGCKPPYLDQFAAAAIGGQPQKFEVFDPHHSLFAQVSVTSPRHGLFVVVASDITERVKSAQKLEHALRELTSKSKEMESLLYVTTHDLRSPLVNIQGFSERIGRALTELERLASGRVDGAILSEKTLLPILERLRGALGYITGSAQKMDRLINGLLQLSRLGRRPLQWSKVDTLALWKKVLAVAQHQLNEAQIAIETGDLPGCYGDAAQLDQVLSNLLDNAIKYRDPGRPCVVSFSGAVDADESVHYQFRDTGRGIDPQHVGRIWELFHRLAPQSDLPGEGIGLTAVRQIMERHRGEITVESALGVGTTFHFSLPAKTQQSQSTAGRRDHE